MLAFCLLSISGIFVFAAQPADPYSGSWHLQSDDSTQIMVERTAESIHVKEEHGGRLTQEYTCTTDGKECLYHEAGRKGKVSLWFNGPYLVEVRTHGDVITKRRFLVKDESKTLQVEVIPVSPEGKTEVIAFTRSR
jgi:hypothetical protein